MIIYLIIHLICAFLACLCFVSLDDKIELGFVLLFTLLGPIALFVMGVVWISSLDIFDIVVWRKKK